MIKILGHALHLYSNLFSVCLSLSSAHFGDVLCSQFPIGRTARIFAKHAFGLHPVPEYISHWEQSIRPIRVPDSSWLESQQLGLAATDLFEDLLYLRTLDLSHKKLESLNWVFFSGLFHRLISMGQNTFFNLASLRQICFNNNPVSKLVPGKLKGLCRSNAADCALSLSLSCYVVVSSMPVGGTAEVWRNNRK